MTYILKWNPDISSTTLAEWEYWIEHFPFIEPNWSVWEHDNADDWDHFYMVKVGSGRTGIVAKGTFTSMPYEGRDWSGKGRQVFYRNLWISNIMHPDRDPMITTAELAKAIPDFDWEKGHSGVSLREDGEKALEKLWKKFVKANPEFIRKQSAFRDYVIEPPALKRVKGYKLWGKRVNSHLFGDMLYTEAATHDCVNLKFSEDYLEHRFRINVLFFNVVLRIICTGVRRVKIDLDDATAFMGDFFLAEAGPELLHLRCNGIELWCTDMEFVEAIDYPDDSYPVTI